MSRRPTRSRRQPATATTTATKGQTMTEKTAAKPHDWFDETKHRNTGTGIVDRTTGFYLAADGRPVSGPARAAALAEAGETKDALGLVSADAIATAAKHRAALERVATTAPGAAAGAAVTE